jgi:hypothetical protein
MGSGMDDWFEFNAWFTLGIDVQGDAVGVLDGKSSISPRVIGNGQSDGMPRFHKTLVGGVYIGDAKVDRQTDRVGAWPTLLRQHELKGHDFLGELKADVPAAVKNRFALNCVT